jgi:VanZ family protein
MVFGLWTEVAQGSAPGRDPSMHDLINDAMGGMMAATLIVGQRILASHMTGRDSSVANVPVAEGVPLK